MRTKIKQKISGAYPRADMKWKLKEIKLFRGFDYSLLLNSL